MLACPRSLSEVGNELLCVFEGSIDKIRKGRGYNDPLIARSTSADACGEVCWSRTPASSRLWHCQWQHASTADNNRQFISYDPRERTTSVCTFLIYRYWGCDIRAVTDQRIELCPAIARPVHLSITTRRYSQGQDLCSFKRDFQVKKHLTQAQVSIPATRVSQKARMVRTVIRSICT